MRHVEGVILYLAVSTSVIFYPDVNSKMDHELIEDKYILVLEAYASCRGCNIIPRSGLLSDNELCSLCDGKQRCINCNRYLGLHLYADGEKRYHACVRK